MIKTARKFTAYIAPVICVLCFSQAASSAVTFLNAGTLGGTNSLLYSFSSGTRYYPLSADGSTLVGASQTTTEVHAFRWKNGVMTDLGTLGGDFSFASGVSDNGSVVIGMARDSNSVEHAFRWTGGVMTDIGDLGGVSALPFALSSDGSVIVGYSYTGTNTHAFRWTGGVMADLGTLGGDSSYALDVSDNGSVVIGLSSTAGNSESHAFRWAGGVMTDLGTLGGNNNLPTALSADGSVIVGYANLAGNNDQHAFRWTGGVMTDLGTLGGSGSIAFAVSADGTTVGGYSETAGGDMHAFIWKNGTISGLGTPANYFSALTSLSTDGSVGAGAISDAAMSQTFIPFRWTQADGIQTIEDILTNNNINHTGWNFASGSDNAIPLLSADGTVMAGNATLNGNFATYLLSYTGSSAALLTPEELAKSIGPAAQSSAQTQSSFTTTVSQSLTATQQVFASFFNSSSGGWPKSASATQSSGVAAGSPALPEKAAYVIGSLGVGQNNDFDSYSSSGTTGMFLRVNPELAVGAGLLASGSHTRLRLDGRSNITSYGGALNVAYEGKDNWRFYGTAGISALNVSMRRNYINGASIDGSRGTTDGIGYGGALRGGYNIPLKKEYSLMPYLEVDVSHTDLDGYTEQGGGAPASFGDQSSDIVISRLGAEIKHQLMPRLEMRGRGAWGHTVSAHGDALTATALTVTTALPYSSGSDKDWLEGGITGIWSLSHNTSFIADLQGRAGKTSEPAIAATVGLTIGF